MNPRTALGEGCKNTCLYILLVGLLPAVVLVIILMLMHLAGWL